MREIVELEPWAGVGNDQATRLRTDEHGAPRRRLAQRVLDQVRGDLEHSVVVGLDPALLASGREDDREGLRRRLVAADRFTRHRRQVDGLAADRELMTVHPREVEQVADEALEPAALHEDRLRGLLGGERPFGEAFRVPADRGQRRLQLVADREQEVALAFARGLELLGHVVERLGEGHELARADLRHRRRRLTRRESMAGRRDTPDRPHDRSGDGEREQRREERAGERGKQEILQERVPGGGAGARGPQQQQPARGDQAVRVQVALPVVGRLAVALASHVGDVRGELRALVDDRPDTARDVVRVVVADSVTARRGEAVGLAGENADLGAVDLLANQHRADRDRQDERQAQRCERRREQPAAKAAHALTAL